MVYIEIIVILILIISVLLLIYFIGINRLKNYKEKMIKAENIINENLIKKQDIIININTNIKKLNDKKDYLKDYLNKDEEISNIEKDFKLDEANNLINNLAYDFKKLAKDSDFNKKLQSLREINESLVAAKNIYNDNAILNNKLIKQFPYNIIAKITNYQVITLYNNNKTDEESL